MSFIFHYCETYKLVIINWPICLAKQFEMSCLICDIKIRPKDYSPCKFWWNDKYIPAVNEKPKYPPKF